VAHFTYSELDLKEGNDKEIVLLPRELGFNGIVSGVIA